MAKLVIIGDIHYGINSVFDSVINDRMSKILQRVNDSDIDVIVQLGDVVDTRKGVNTETGQSIFDYYINPIQKMNKELIQIVGNHDCYYNSTNKVNIFTILLKDRIKKCTIVEESFYHPSIKSKFYGWGVDPIKLENQFPISFNEKYIFGHWEIPGFEKARGVIHDKGVIGKFLGYNKVFSGHYHRANTKDNIVYTGSLIDDTFDSMDTFHGYYILDTDTDTIEKFGFDDPIHIKFVYDGKNQFDFDRDYNKNVVKILKISDDGYADFIEKLKQKNIFKLTEQFVEVDLQNIFEKDNDNIAIESPMMIFKEYVETSSSIKVNPKNLLDLVKTTYEESIQRGNF